MRISNVHGEDEKKTLQERPAAVSYTHLAVYKTQARNAPETTVPHHASGPRPADAATSPDELANAREQGGIPAPPPELQAH